MQLSGARMVVSIDLHAAEAHWSSGLSFPANVKDFGSGVVIQVIIKKDVIVQPRSTPGFSPLVVNCCSCVSRSGLGVRSALAPAADIRIPPAWYTTASLSRAASNSPMARHRRDTDIRISVARIKSPFLPHQQGCFCNVIGSSWVCNASSPVRPSVNSSKASRVPRPHRQMRRDTSLHHHRYHHAHHAAVNSVRDPDCVRRFWSAEPEISSH